MTSKLICQYEGCNTELTIHVGSGRQPQFCSIHKCDAPLRLHSKEIPRKLIGQKQKFIVNLCDDCNRPINSPTFGKSKPSNLCAGCKAQRKRDRENKRYAMKVKAR